MEERLISFETAKLAKEKRFYLNRTLNYDCKDGSFIYFGNNQKDSDKQIKKKYLNGELKSSDGEPVYLRTPQSLLQKWIREKYKLHIVIIPTVTGNMTYKIIDIQCNPEHEIERPPYKNIDAHDYNDYESALEAGLQEALKLI